MESILSVHKDVSVKLTTKKKTCNWENYNNRNPWNYRSSVNIVSFGSTTAQTPSSQNQSKPQTVLYVHVPDGKISVTSSTSSFCHLCLLLAPPSAKCAMIQVTWHQSTPYRYGTLSCSWLLFVLEICTCWMKKELLAIATETDTIVLVVSVVAEVELHHHQTGTTRCLGYKNILLITRKTEAQRLTDECPESSKSSKNSTAVPTTVLPVPLGSQPSRDRRTEKSVIIPLKNLIFFPGRSSDVIWWKTQQRYKHCESSRTTIIQNNGHWCGVHGLSGLEERRYLR